MALDGAMMRLLAREIEQKLDGAKVDKVQQPSREELVFTMRGRNGAAKLLISVRAAFPRIGFIPEAIENPAQPPMLCMLLRKQLCGARFAGVRQQDMDRVLMLDFDGTNELGDRRRLTIIVEIMGRCSNAVLIDGDGKIIDALKRVDGAMSSQRMILPGMRYTPPPAQDKFAPTVTPVPEMIERILSGNEQPLHKAILSAVQGLSPVIARELAYRSCGSTDILTSAVSVYQRACLAEELGRFSMLLAQGGQPTMLQDPQGRLSDVAVMSITQYGGAVSTRSYPDVSSLLEAFSGAKDAAERMKVKSHDLLRVLASASDHVSRRLAAQQKELESASGRDLWRLYGDLISANIFRLEKGAAFCDLENYYETDGSTVRIALDPMLTPSQNAQHYYKKYRRAQTAEAHLLPLIESGKQELEYIDAVFDSLSRASTAAEVAEIRVELTEGGYIRTKGQSPKRQPSALPPLKFRSDDGFEILVGRNNRQNDRLTLHTAAKTDIWLHSLGVPGAHVIIRTDGVRPPDSTIEQAAIIAAYHSRGREAGTVPVDFTLVKKVFKPGGAKPGMVNYTDQQTVFVHPDGELVESLRVKK